MSGRPGPLFVDGERVGDRWLERAVGHAAAAFDAIGPDARVTASADPVATVVAALAARRTGNPLALSARRGPGDASVAEVRLTGGAAEVAPLRAAVPPAPLPAGTAAIFTTSGSSGEPKQVALSAAALDYQGAATRERLGVEAGDGMCVPVPPHHAYGFSVLQMWQLTGASLYLESSFRPDRIAERLADPRVTTLDGVPSMYAALLNRAARDTGLARRLADLRVRGCGGDVLPSTLAERFRQVVGAPIHDGYGLTEAGPNVAVSGPGCWRPGTVGPPLTGTRVRVSDEGELLVRGPGLMLGYVGDPAATARTIDPEGWLHTGDLAGIDPDGHVRVLGRSKDVLIIHGETFAPSEVEAALADHAGVAEACVVPVRSGQARGDRILAFVVADGRQPADTLVAGLRQQARVRLPAVLRPVDIRLVDALPRLASGKPDRQELRRWGAPAWVS